MNTFGELLERAREEQGVTLDSVSRATRIQRRYLEALERGDLDALPGRVFDKGFIRAYAEYLQIDPEPVLASYAEAARQRGAPESDPGMIEEMGKLLESRGSGGERIGSRAMKLGLYGAPVLVFLIGVSWLALRPSASPSPELASVVRSQAARVPPEPVPSPKVQEKNELDRIRIPQSGVGTELVDRNLGGRGTRFVEGTKLWYWTRVLGGTEGERIIHVWMHEGRPAMRAVLDLGGPHWRTYSALALPAGAVGPWTVEARAADGRVLARDEFVCVPSGEPRSGVECP